MDFEGNMFCLNNGNREQNGNSNNSTSFGWDLWEPTSSSNSTLINTFYTADTSTAVAPTRHEASLANALMFLPQATTAADRDHHERRPPPLDGSHAHLDPNLVCLKLGKRHYFEDANAPLSGGAVLVGKRGRGRGYHGGGEGGGGVTTAATVPRCQVEGCHVALLNAKDYHRRHKVCEMHSKAPKVVVLGLEQRFCQQCSRFHVVSEFDDSKRSCRRRLAGHNERRRKSFHESVARNSSQEKRFMVGGFPYLSSPPPPPSSGCVLSLLSSCKNDHPWLSPADLSTRCSAALRELIAENRAAIMSKQIILDRDWHHHHHDHHHHAAVVEDDGINKEVHSQSNYSFPQHHQMFP